MAKTAEQKRIETSREIEPVGVQEIAQRLGVHRDAVYKWQTRTYLEFPAPKWFIGGGDVWDWKDVRSWAKRTGRWRAGGWE